ncbi:MAG: sialate O-acetylesterase, partial [Methylococcaceae bacterium]|nr:sialate O-acetylesterase [Methylococcaceae bacterium]
MAATPETVLDFTVIGYFFAKKLYDQYHVPMGIVNTCVGGTTIEAWMSEEGFTGSSTPMARSKWILYRREVILSSAKQST